ncbi:MAG: thiamine phosphate synthase [Planctomycetota bacterium]
MSFESSSLRIVDANLNRAAEGLRVVEDVCRFHWNLVGLAGELKQLRHAVLQAGRPAGRTSAAQLAARDVSGDVGRAFGVAGATGRPVDGGDSDSSLEVTALTNVERVREALRTLEEVTRGTDPGAAQRFESARYRLYAVEKTLGALCLRNADDTRLRDAKLYLLATESLCRGEYWETIESALKAGVDVVQLREKDEDGASLLAKARRLRELTARHGKLLIVNDRADLAKLAHADGVHVGQDDLRVADVRAVLGADSLVGVSTHSPEQARAAVLEGADYIGAGPMFPTSTKDAGPRLAFEDLQTIGSETPVPVFAIGGIDAKRVAEITPYGATRVAVSSVILGSDEAAATTEELRRALGASPDG